MIVTELYNGQGLGNQLWCYVTTRIIALERGLDFGIQCPERFKGFDFMDLDFGSPVLNGEGPDGGPPNVLPDGITHYYVEQNATHTPSGSDIRCHDNMLSNISDGTKIDGLFQDSSYVERWETEIRKWMTIRKEFECYDFSSENICIINFRGGTYIYDDDFFLPKKYWVHAIANMRAINPYFKFVVITDDIQTAKRFFPNFDVFHFSIAKDYSIINSARYLIISNSSFAWFPTWLNNNLKFCIAPKYWARHNISDGYWSLGYSITKGWHYQDREGKLYDVKTCSKEFGEYLEKNKNLIIIKRKFDPNIIYTAKVDNTKTIENRMETFGHRGFVAWMIFVKTWRYVSPAKALKKIPTAVTKIIRLSVSMVIKRTNRTLTVILISMGRSLDVDENGMKSIMALKSDIPELYKRIMAKFIEPILLAIKERKVKQGWLTARQIANYRKSIKIYDTFTFFNELDLLEIRLNILDPYVDYFVLLESTRTHSGHDKPLYYEKNMERFAKWNKKIIHYVVRDAPDCKDDLRKRLYDKQISRLDRQIAIDSLTTDNTGNGEVAWLREFYMKESLKDALDKACVRDNDICFFSDLDEIWNPELVIDYSKDNIFKLIQKCYMYYLNNRTNEHWSGWSGTIVTKYKNVKKTCLNHLRTYGKMKNQYSILRNGGWHFTFQGGYKGAKQKIVEADHPVWNRINMIMPGLKQKIAINKDYKGRFIRLWKDEVGLPRYLLKNKEKYQEFFKN